MDRRTAAEREHIAIMTAVASDLASLPLALKGGTALLLCYGLDRFSEDIDLDGRKKLNLRSRLGAVLYADIYAHRRALGRPISQFDAQIAAICKARGATFATRNVTDFADIRLKLINPWSAP